MQTESTGMAWGPGGRRTGSVESALRHWEHKVRYLTDITQLWGIRYDKFTKNWPSALRPFIIQLMGRVKFLNERMRIADRGLAVTGLPTYGRL